MHGDHRSCGRPRTALLAVAAGLVLVGAPAASAMTPPSPGLRVVWETDESIETGEAALTASAALPEAGQWPRVDRIDARSAVAPPALDAGPGLDVRGRQLPDRRSAESEAP